MTATIHHGDCLDVLRGMPDNSVDAVVCDPPYGLSNTTPEKVTDTIVRWAQGDREYVPTGKGFMGASWDAFVPPVAVWDECLRVLKPGGHLVAFAGSRTQDLMGLAIRLAGFDLRDSIAWIAGSGFPKSLNVGKSPLFCQCEEVEYNHDHGELRGMREAVRDVSAHSEKGEESDVLPAVQRGSSGTRVGDARAQGCARTEDLYTDDGRSEPGMEGRGDVQAVEGELRRPAIREVPGGMAHDGPEGRVHHGAPVSDGRMDRASTNQDRSGEPQEPRSSGQSQGEPGTVSDERGSQARGSRPLCGRCGKSVCAEGLGTALKPAVEPIILARKPFPGTVASNVLTHGTGALNIDATRIGTTDTLSPGSNNRANSAVDYRIKARADGPTQNPAGRWPANVVLDPVAAEALDQQSGISKDGTAVKRNGVVGGMYSPSAPEGTPDAGYGGQGGASRFFKVVEPDPPFMYAAKAPKRERPSYTTEDGQTVQHATVKPLSIMQWLVKLVTPEGGTILDPFAGSGTTVEAAILEGFNVIGIEREAEYLPLIQQRIDRATPTDPGPADDLLGLLDGAA